MQPNSTSSLAIPVAIIAGFALIAAAIFFSGDSTPTASPKESNTVPAATTKTVVRPVDETDNIKGNPNAPIMVVEYSDYDCPYCKIFDETMNKIMDDYGVTGKVAWVYRQFPIVQLHPNTARISEAAYCVAELGSNDAFWKFSKEVFDSREVNVQTDMTQLPIFAEKAGVNRAEFNTCLDSGKFQDKVQQSVAEAAAAGANGTPYSVVIVGDQQAVINGAQPYTVVKQIIDNLVAQLNGNDAPNQAE
ncbi:hypothetical protein A2592_02135 [Candidatus Kaiserbacteria bacterium RIFOXYD1_FULL_42_15]|uniref:Thioredoxin domain-containing protein n=1 Tax=Candidatus Kaiserbacteria bacterium RIFOXYD1_FULL_42_15 TaxID=1798532 RepID=A0A1F6FS18_9BACT|nr:MAG: hypothetical protein A2592_02135 [Candidatus Kaiserbacteria bacterium RIFOXYD1_FULL_42_15]